VYDLRDQGNCFTTSLVDVIAIVLQHILVSFTNRRQTINTELGHCIRTAYGVCLDIGSLINMSQREPLVANTSFSPRCSSHATTRMCCINLLVKCRTEAKLHFFRLVYALSASLLQLMHGIEFEGSYHPHTRLFGLIIFCFTPPSPNASALAILDGKHPTG